MKKKLPIKLLLVASVLTASIFVYNSINSTSVEKKVKDEEISKAKRGKEYSEYFRDITTQMGSKKSTYPNSYRYNELKKALAKKSGRKVDYTWISRGPANIGGRTRTLVVDPDDATNSTWYVGAATGGVWKTTDKGDNWVNLTSDLPNLSTNTLVMAETDHDIMYAGTGESYPGGTYLAGSGIFKSTDRGETWTLLSSTANNDNFVYVNRLIIDPNDENTLLAGTNSGIFKTTDGGDTWIQKFSSETNVEQILFEPGNFNIQYASVKYEGVVKSIDAGESWEITNNQLIPTGRIELAVSPVNTNHVFASVDEPSTDVENGIVPTVYISRDKGANWVVYKQSSSTKVDFLSQGGYDNTIAGHPYNENEVFVGGVNINKISFSGEVSQSEPKVLNAYTSNTDSFLDFINFGGKYLGGGMDNEDGENPIDVLDTDWCSIEVQFGPGKSQMAHRFTVGGEGSGVPASGYIYEDYVEVPFEVWDVTNNRQLMVSFRDQEEDGAFDLEARVEEDPSIGREYIFVNAVPYNAAAADANIAKDGGRAYKQLYFFWPTLATGGIWDHTNLPESKIVINYGTQDEQLGSVTKIADAYGSVNSYQQSAGMGTTKIPGLHPDHHAIHIIPGATENDDFTIINANDGGLAISENSGTSFEMKINSYRTTQFYGVSKKHGAHEYIGGMQDNGTWQSANADKDAYYYFRIGGDGFETLWHYTNPDKLIGSIYYNDFRASTDGGNSWEEANSLIGEDGPFISKLSNSKSKSDIVYAVGSKGVWKNKKFGDSFWFKKVISENWTDDSGVRSSHNVEVSIANDNIVWAGAGMANDYGFNLFVSTDEGESFANVNDYAKIKMDAFISGIATHPVLDSTAFALFSLNGMPKVLRTDDLGENWRDITGFDNLPAKAEYSSNGFPDVVVNDLIVMPHDTSVIWVGTDIGIFESTNSGQDWHILSGNLPFVSVYQMHSVDDQIVIATHGRGIWTCEIPELRKAPIITGVTYDNLGTFTLDIETYDVADSIQIFYNNEYDTTLVENISADAINSFELKVNSKGNYKIHAKAFHAGIAYESNATNKEVTVTSIPSLNKEVRRLEVFPNPSSGIVNFKLNSATAGKEYAVKVHTLSGKEVYSRKANANTRNQLNLEHLNNGQYILMLYVNGEYYVEKLLIKK